MDPIPRYDSVFLNRMKNYEDLSSIKLTASLKKYFIAGINRKKIVISTAETRRIVKMLHPVFKSLTNEELSRFEEVLRYYIVSWPRFNDLSSVYNILNKGKDEFINCWYKEFSMYVIIKMEDACKIWKEELKHHVNSNLVDNFAQTASISDESITNVCLAVQGPASLLYSSVFNVDGEEVYLQEHVTQPLSESYRFNIEGFLNLPYVSVRGRIGNFTFERNNVHNIERILSKKPLELKRKFNKTVHMQKVDNEKPVDVYTKNVIIQYLKQLVDLLQKSKRLDKLRIKECLLLTLQILQDVDEHLDSVPTNVKVTYNMGDNIYIRIKQTTSKMVKLHEIITPKVALIIHGFSPVQDTTNKTRLNFFEKNEMNFVEHINKYQLIFSCTFCSKDFPSLLKLHSHFQLKHREEHDVVCGNCRKQIKVSDLVQKRWNHFCASPNHIMKN